VRRKTNNQSINAKKKQKKNKKNKKKNKTKKTPLQGEINPSKADFAKTGGIFHLYEDIFITGEGLQNLVLCSAPRAFGQGGIFIVPHLL
jgi:hypothetical protein